MPGLTGLAGLTGLSGLVGSYIDKVLGYGPIAYWPLYETAGATAACLVNSAQNGAYTGVTLGQTVTDANGVTFVCPLFDGANDFVNIHSLALAGAFDGDEGTLMIWARVFNAGVWTDGTDRFAIQTPYGNGTNGMKLQKDDVNNSLRWNRIANGITDGILDGGYSSTDWFHMTITWSVVADENVYYYNGAEIGNDVTLGAWNTALFNANRNNIGCNDNGGPGAVWNGWLAHGVLFDTVLTDPQVLDLATV